MQIPYNGSKPSQYFYFLLTIGLLNNHKEVALLNWLVKMSKQCNEMATTFYYDSKQDQKSQKLTLADTIENPFGDKLIKNYLSGSIFVNNIEMAKVFIHHNS